MPKTAKMNRSALLALVPVLLGGLTNPAVARQTRGPKALPRTLRYFEAVTNVSVARGKRGTAVSLHTLGKQFDLDLEPNDLFAPGAKDVWIGDTDLSELAPAIELYKGRLKGQPDSWVRVSLQNGALDGMIWTPDETYFVQPRARFSSDAASNDMIAYRLSDTDSDWLPGSCAADDAPAVRTGHSSGTVSAGTGDSAALTTSVTQGTSTTLEEAGLALVADYEYFLDHGANSAADMQSLLNQVDGIYRADVGVTLKITQTVVYTTASDPFSSTTSPSSLLGEFSSYKNTPGSPVYGSDLAHLFTNRDLDGSVIGIAWLGSVCSDYYGSSLSQDYTTDNKSLVILTAHEIGHNFNAPHDNETGSPCGSVPFGYIMNPYVSTSLSLHFSDCSKSFITAEAASAVCLDPVSDVTPTSTATPTLTSVPSDTSTPTQTPAGPASTPANTPIPTATATPTNSFTPTATPTLTPPPTQTPTLTPTHTLTRTPVPTRTKKHPR